MAYRFNGTSDYVEFAIAPLSGAPIGPWTFATLLKRSTTTQTRNLLRLINSGGSDRWVHKTHSSSVLQTLDTAGTPASGAQLLNNTALWYLIAITMPAGATGVPRDHVHDETSWTHENTNNTLTRVASIAGTDRLLIAHSGTFFFAGDMVCAGIKKADSTDLQVQALSRTAFSAWVSFGFDWLIGFDSSLEAGGILQDQASPGTGDEIAISGTSQVSDPPGWSWATAPPSTFVPQTIMVS